MPGSPHRDDRLNPVHRQFLAVFRESEDNYAETDALADELGITPSTVYDHKHFVGELGYEIEYDRSRGAYQLINEPSIGTGSDERGDPETGYEPDLSIHETDDRDEEPEYDFTDEPIAEDEPKESDLTDREKFVLRNVQTGTTVNELADELGDRQSVVTQHLRDLRSSGWQIYRDETTEDIAIEGDHALRSSEHIGTRTRKSNRWWELNHNRLVREFRSLETPTHQIQSTPGNEDWITHVTDLHSGDRVRQADGSVVYNAETIPKIIDYITEKSLELADYHGTGYDAAHLLYGGDLLTFEGVYEGMFEDLDAWLDEQHDILIDPLVRQIKAHSERFKHLNVVCQVGNHAKNRASGTSRSANSDLILYKTLRNVIAQIREHTSDLLENVEFLIGEARSYRRFPLRGGEHRGLLLHGQNRRPQGETSARLKEWLITLQNHDPSIVFAGHHHVSGRVPWNGPPIIFSGSAKPADDWVEEIGVGIDLEPREIAHCVGFADHGITSVMPLKTHGYTYP